MKEIILSQKEMQFLLDWFISTKNIVELTKDKATQDQIELFNKLCLKVI